jgi:hypothetical protein
MLQFFRKLSLFKIPAIMHKIFSVVIKVSSTLAVISLLSYMNEKYTYIKTFPNVNQNSLILHTIIKFLENVKMVCTFTE